MASHSHVETWIFATPHLPDAVPSHPGVYLHVALEHSGEMLDLLVTVAVMTRVVRQILDRFADRF
jgi:hypothetical protein